MAAMSEWLYSSIHSTHNAKHIKFDEMFKGKRLYCWIMKGN